MLPRNILIDTPRQCFTGSWAFDIPGRIACKIALLSKPQMYLRLYLFDVRLYQNLFFLKKVHHSLPDIHLIFLFLIATDINMYLVLQVHVYMCIRKQSLPLRGNAVNKVFGESPNSAFVIVMMKYLGKHTRRREYIIHQETKIDN